MLEVAHHPEVAQALAWEDFLWILCALRSGLDHLQEDNLLVQIYVQTLQDQKPHLPPVWLSPSTSNSRPFRMTSVATSDSMDSSCTL